MLPSLLAETMQVLPAKHIFCNVSRGQHVYVVCASKKAMKLNPNLKKILNFGLKGIDICICIVCFFLHDQTCSIILSNRKFI